MKTQKVPPVKREISCFHRPCIRSRRDCNQVLALGACNFFRPDRACSFVAYPERIVFFSATQDGHRIAVEFTAEFLETVIQVAPFTSENTVIHRTDLLFVLTGRLEALVLGFCAKTKMIVVHGRANLTRIALHVREIQPLVSVSGNYALVAYQFKVLLLVRLEPACAQNKLLPVYPFTYDICTMHSVQLSKTENDCLHALIVADSGVYVLSLSVLNSRALCVYSNLFSVSEDAFMLKSHLNYGGIVVFDRYVREFKYVNGGNYSSELLKKEDITIFAQVFLSTCCEFLVGDSKGDLYILNINKLYEMTFVAALPEPVHHLSIIGENRFLGCTDFGTFYYFLYSGSVDSFKIVKVVRSFKGVASTSKFLDGGNSRVICSMTNGFNRKFNQKNANLCGSLTFLKESSNFSRQSNFSTNCSYAELARVAVEQYNFDMDRCELLHLRDNYYCFAFAHGFMVINVGDNNNKIQIVTTQVLLTESSEHYSDNVHSNLNSCVYLVDNNFFLVLSKNYAVLMRQEDFAVDKKSVYFAFNFCCYQQFRQNYILAYNYESNGLFCIDYKSDSQILTEPFYSFDSHISHGKLKRFAVVSDEVWVCSFYNCNFLAVYDAKENVEFVKNLTFSKNIVDVRYISEVNLLFVGLVNGEIYILLPDLLLQTKENDTLKCCLDKLQLPTGIGVESFLFGSFFAVNEKINYFVGFLPVIVLDRLKYFVQFVLKKNHFEKVEDKHEQDSTQCVKHAGSFIQNALNNHNNSYKIYRVKKITLTNCNIEKVDEIKNSYPKLFAFNKSSQCLLVKHHNVIDLTLYKHIDNNVSRQQFFHFNNDSVNIEIDVVDFFPHEMARYANKILLLAERDDGDKFQHSLIVYDHFNKNIEHEVEFNEENLHLLKTHRLQSSWFNDLDALKFCEPHNSLQIVAIATSFATENKVVQGKLIIAQYEDLLKINDDNKKNVFVFKQRVGDVVFLRQYMMVATAGTIMLYKINSLNMAEDNAISYLSHTTDNVQIMRMSVDAEQNLLMVCSVSRKIKIYRLERNDEDGQMNKLSCLNMHNPLGWVTSIGVLGQNNLFAFGEISQCLTLYKVTVVRAEALSLLKYQVELKMSKNRNVKSKMAGNQLFDYSELFNERRDCNDAESSLKKKSEQLLEDTSTDSEQNPYKELNKENRMFDRLIIDRYHSKKMQKICQDSANNEYRMKMVDCIKMYDYVCKIEECSEKYYSKKKKNFKKFHKYLEVTLLKGGVKRLSEVKSQAEYVFLAYVQQAFAEMCRRGLRTKGYCGQAITEQVIGTGEVDSLASRPFDRPTINMDFVARALNISRKNKKRLYKLVKDKMMDDDNEEYLKEVGSFKCQDCMGRLERALKRV